jgi:hypothetical protein
MDMRQLKQMLGILSFQKMLKVPYWENGRLEIWVVE